MAIVVYVETRAPQMPFVWVLWGVLIGYLLRRWWAVLLGFVPWPLGLGVGLWTGRYPFLGDAWQVVGVVSILLPLIGILVGVSLAQIRPTSRS